MTEAPSAKPKVFIKTFGCQMNEYDSDKMADVLRAAEGYEPTDDVEQADLILFNTCSVREKAQEKVFSDLGRVKHLKSKGVLIGVGGCVASQEGAAIVERAPYVDLVFGPQTLHRLPAADRAAPRDAAAAGRHQLSRDREVRPPAAGARRRRDRLRLDHGRLLEVLLATASCPTRAAKRCRGRSTTCSTEVAGLADQGVQGSDAARPERQRLPRRDGRTARDRRLRAADRVRRRDPRHRAHPLHHQPSERVHAAR